MAAAEGVAFPMSIKHFSFIFIFALSQGHKKNSRELEKIFAY